MSSIKFAPERKYSAKNKLASLAAWRLAQNANWMVNHCNSKTDRIAALLTASDMMRRAAEKVATFNPSLSQKYTTTSTCYKNRANRLYAKKNAA